MASSRTPNGRGLRAELLNLDEIDVEYEVERDLRKGRMPRIPREKVYEKAGFLNSSSSSSSIKIFEEQVGLKMEQETLRLFDRKFIHQHSKKYSFVHLGLVQVMALPYGRLGTPESIQLRLKDPNSEGDPFMAMLETSMCEGPVYFQCYPNRKFPLRNSLVLEARKNGYHMVPGTIPFSLWIRVCCKLMRSEDDEARALNESPTGESIHFQVIFEGSGHRVVPRRTRWDQIAMEEEPIGSPRCESNLFHIFAQGSTTVITPRRIRLEEIILGGSSEKMDESSSIPDGMLPEVG